MATLNPSNVINGNVIQASDILQLFEAFGTGSQNITGLSLTGSITNAITALTSSITNNIIVPVTSSGIYYPVIVDGAGTKPPRILSTFELSGSVLNNITASQAITASFASNSTVTQVNTQYYDNGVNTVPADFKFVAGKIAMTSGAATSSIFTNLIGKVIGNTVWINASYPEAFTTTPGQSLLKVNASSSGQVLISGAPSDTGTIIFTGIYI
jgi:hypothetical protein